MATIICYDIHGNSIPVAPEALTFRPAVYGIFIETNQILLSKQAETNLWHPPGRTLTDNETPTQAVRQTFRRLTGVTPRLGPMLFVEEQYFIDNDRRAWHFSLLYYALSRPATASTVAESEKTAWIPLADLKRSQIQFGYEAIQAGRLQLNI